MYGDIPRTEDVSHEIFCSINVRDTQAARSVAVLTVGWRLHGPPHHRYVSVSLRGNCAILPRLLRCICDLSRSLSTVRRPRTERIAGERKDFVATLTNRVELPRCATYGYRVAIATTQQAGSILFLLRIFLPLRGVQPSATPPLPRRAVGSWKRRWRMSLGFVPRSPRVRFLYID